MVGSAIKRKRKSGRVVTERRYGCRSKDSAKRACGCGKVFRNTGDLA
jgi:site-specific DNA recombinase